MENSTSYDKRYLDALASVLLISSDKNPVAAVTRVGDIYYLAYNDSREAGFEQNYESKLLEILECINTGEWTKLLALHILCNKVDFLDRLSHEFLGESVDLPKLKSKLKKDADRVTTTEKEIVSMKRRLETIEKIENIKPVVESIKRAFEQIATISVDSVYKTYVDLLTSLPREVKRPTKYSELINPSDELIQTILRPLQNVTKLKCYIEKKLPQFKLVSTENLIFLDDITAKIEGVGVVHAEVRLAHHLGKATVEGTYIGASRLCCAGCHKVLDDGGYEHRGTSGMFFSSWKCVDKGIPGKLIISAVERAKGKSLKDQEDEYRTRKESMQRDLSEDQEYEELAVLQEVELHRIKIDLGIITHRQLRVEEKQSEKVVQDAGIALMEIDKEDSVSLSGNVEISIMPDE